MNWPFFNLINTFILLGIKLTIKSGGFFSPEELPWISRSQIRAQSG